MPTSFSYYHPITIRYSDLDPQGHVNNAAHFTFLESARLGYYEKVGIWEKDSGKTTGMVVVHNEIDYLAPIFLHQQIQIGLKLVRLGEKSLTLAFQIETSPKGLLLARGQTVLVVFDNQTNQSLPIPQKWRDKITQFESTDEKNEFTSH